MKMIMNLKIGHKMLLLSGVLLLLICAVFMGGKYGLDKSAENGEQVSKTLELNNIFATLEIDHLAWANDVSRFVNDDRVHELHVKTDPSQCACGKWLEGGERKVVEQEVPAITDDLRALEIPHRKLHETAQKIKANYRIANSDLPHFLTQKELEHNQWANRLQQAILNKHNHADIETDHRLCALGRFLYGEERRQQAAENSELARIYDALETPHKELHNSGKSINSLLAAKQYNQAADLYARQTSATLAEVGQIIKKGVLFAEAQIEGKMKAQEIFTSETQQHLATVKSLLENVRGKMQRHKEEITQASLAANSAITRTNLAIGIFALLLGSAIAVVISRSLTGPIQQTVAMLTEMEHGHLENRLRLNRNDEIGVMASSLDRFADSMQQEMIVNLQNLAAGNLDFDVIPHDKNDAIRGALKQLGNDLNEMVKDIRVAGDQIASGSCQVADSSQSLSQGATEQASSLEEISASLNELSSQTSANASNANQANQLAIEAQQAARQGGEKMKDMVSAMSEINEAGQNISKIIKTIDEIAFQTNLLALNAAVEAARAGQHGKGFAVVAEEVRNLAARSAKAAEETAQLIEGSVEKTENGSIIANQTAEALEEIFNGISKTTDLVAEIAAASNEQAEGVNQINQGVTQIDQVTQQNTANAEESAAAAEELSGQADALKQMLGRFRLRNAVETVDSISWSRQIDKVADSPDGWDDMAQNVSIALDDTDFGKF